MISAAYLWIVLPLIIAGFMFVFHQRKYFVNLLGLATAIGLFLASRFLPIGKGFVLLGKDFFIANDLFLFGRNFQITQQTIGLVALIYLVLAYWYIATLFVEMDSYFFPISFTVVPLYIAAFTVKPFLYAALILAIIALLYIFLFDQHVVSVRKGSVRFLSYQLIGMSFILFAGWGFESINPYDFNLHDALIALGFFGFGVVLIMGVFPFNSWISMLSENTEPLFTTFFFSIQTGFISLFVLNFFSEYVWIEEIPAAYDALLFAGAVMLLVGGIWGAFQTDLRRLFSYMVIIEIGRSLVALSLQYDKSLFYGFYLTRLMWFGLWGLTLVELKRNGVGFKLEEIVKRSGKSVVLIIALMMVIFNVSGFPLFAEFPFLFPMYQSFVDVHHYVTIALFVASAGMLIAGFRFVYAFGVHANAIESRIFVRPAIRVLILLGIFGLLAAGIFPQWVMALFEKTVVF